MSNRKVVNLTWAAARLRSVQEAVDRKHRVKRLELVNDLALTQAVDEARSASGPFARKREGKDFPLLSFDMPMTPLQEAFAVYRQGDQGE